MSVMPVDYIKTFPCIVLDSKNQLVSSDKSCDVNNNKVNASFPTVSNTVIIGDRIFLRATIDGKKYLIPMIVQK